MSSELQYVPVKRTRATRQERILIRRPYRFFDGERGRNNLQTIGKFEWRRKGWVFRLNGQDEVTLEELAEILGVMEELPT